MIVGVDRLLHEGFVNDHPVHLDVIVVLNEVTSLTIAIPGAGGDIPVAAHVHVTRDVNTTRLQQVVHLPPILEGPLHLQIV